MYFFGFLSALIRIPEIKASKRPLKKFPVARLYNANILISQKSVCFT